MKQNKLKYIFRYIIQDASLRVKMVLIFFMVLILPFCFFTLYATRRISSVIQEQNFLAAGKTFAQALHTRTFEPDGPNYTPRISGLVHGNGDYTLSILKSADGKASSCRRYFFAYENPIAGQGHFIHTYLGDGDPLPSFEGEPEQVAITSETPQEFAHLLWNNLNEDNEGSLCVRYGELERGGWESGISNQRA